MWAKLKLIKKILTQRKKQSEIPLSFLTKLITVSYSEWH